MDCGAVPAGRGDSAVGVVLLSDQLYLRGWYLQKAIFYHVY